MLLIFTEAEGPPYFYFRSSWPTDLEGVSLMYCVPHHKKCYQVWSWYNHPLPSYSVIAADTLRDLVSLTFDLLSLVSGHTRRVIWSTPLPSLVEGLTTICKELWVLTFAIGYHWQCSSSHCACAVSRDLCVGSKFFPHISNHWPRFAYSLYNLYGSTIKTNWVIRHISV